MPNRRARRRRVAHDAAWKQFFALPVMVEHLLRGFAAPVAGLLDFSTLGDISGEWVQDGRRRQAAAQAARRRSVAVPSCVRPERERRRRVRSSGVPGSVDESVGDVLVASRADRTMVIRKAMYGGAPLPARIAVSTLPAVYNRRLRPPDGNVRSRSDPPTSWRWSVR